MTGWHDFSAFNHVLQTWPFRGYLYSQASRETALIFIACLIFHQLNIKPDTIKSHKIQGNNLLQLQHFLSWNKANIKYSCKSQFYSYDVTLHRNITLL